MAYTNRFESTEPTRARVDAQPDALLLEFGTPWCGHCSVAQPAIADALEARPTLAHLKIEDGPGRRLGRSFRIKLWPTLVLVRAGEELGRVVRPREISDVAMLLQQVDS